MDRLLLGSVLLSLVWGCGGEKRRVEGEPDSGMVASTDGSKNDAAADAGVVIRADASNQSRRYPGACTEISSDGAGAVFRTTTNTYDERGLLRTRVSMDVIGNVTDRTELIYDERGLRVESRSDTGDDGTVETRYRYTYDASNRLSTLEQVDSSDVIVWRATYAYNEAGQLATATFWNQPDYSTITYIHGSFGPVTAEYFDAQAQLVGRLTYSYNERRNLVTLTFQWPADSARSYRNSYTYDTNGNLLTVDTDYGPNGTIEYHTTYTYECFAAE